MKKSPVSKLLLRVVFLLSAVMALSCGPKNDTVAKPAKPEEGSKPAVCYLLPPDVLADLDKEIADVIQGDTSLPWIKSFFAAKKQLIDKIDLAIGSNVSPSRFTEQNGNWVPELCSEILKCDKEFLFSFTDGSAISFDRDRFDDLHSMCTSISLVQPPNSYTMTDSCYDMGFWNYCSDYPKENRYIVSLGTPQGTQWQSSEINGNVGCGTSGSTSKYYLFPFGGRTDSASADSQGARVDEVEFHTSSFKIHYRNLYDQYGQISMVVLQVNDRKAEASLAEVLAQCPELLSDLDSRAPVVSDMFKQAGIRFSFTYPGNL